MSKNKSIGQASKMSKSFRKRSLLCISDLYLCFVWCAQLSCTVDAIYYLCNLIKKKFMFLCINSSLFTRIRLNALITHITLYLTTPFKFAPALPLFIQLMSIKAASTTKYITIIDTATHCTIAWTSNRAQRSNT